MRHLVPARIPALIVTAVTALLLILTGTAWAALQGLAADPQFANVHYVDLRRTLPNALPGDAYKDWWANELHPTESGFDAVTAKFANVLSAL